MAPLFVAGAAAIAGIATHISYFNKNEHAMYGLRYLQLGFVAFCLAVAGLMRIGEESFSSALLNVAALEGSFLAGVFASLLVYRVLLSPLNKFPGPFPARVTSLWYCTQVGPHANAQHVLLKFHEKYGDFVRVGSSDLSIIHPEAVNVIYGPGTKCLKGSWYDNDWPMTSMQTTRNRVEHDRRRRLWSPAFSDKALRGYEDRIKPYGEKLVRELGAFAGASVDVSKWFNFYSFDVMGDLAFGRSFDMLEDGKEHWAIKLLNEGMAPIALNLPPWMFRLVAAIPGLAAGYWKFIGYCSDMLEKRYAVTKQENPDIMSTLLAPYAESRPTGLELKMLQGDSRLIIVAGSDTTAATLTHLFCYLCLDPSQVTKLREELAPLVEEDGEVKHVKVQNAEHLNACIHETLRLSPPVPSAVHRLTPPEGIDIGDVHIPGNTNVFVPQHVISRSEKVYTDALTFYPERWYSEPSMIKNKTAWAPFGAGVYGCIGRPLAMMELRTVITKLIMAYDVSFAPGEDGHKLLYETKDHFTMGLAPLELKFTSRKV